MLMGSGFMKILIPTMGTRGDIQPYIALSRKLIDSGFEVTIATHHCWKEMYLIPGCLNMHFDIFIYERGIFE
ncbi:MAG: glycosyl transferase family [Lachnospiraceae bacterium]|jgi:UDP:flavonoid glycosyltransferase YjiC (YdhE family)|nr:glycosyl transferase family [Lachnospiraceae bacterium]